MSHFTEAEYELECHDVLATSSIQDVKPPPGILCRRFETKSDWEKAFELESHLGFSGIDGAEYRSFLHDQFDAYRRLVERSDGCWFGAFRDGFLTSSLGLFWRDGLARFQMVTTAPDYRRQGLATSLVSFAGRFALGNQEIRTLVIVSEMDSTAGRIYRCLGFQKSESYIVATRLAQH